MFKLKKMPKKSLTTAGLVCLAIGLTSAHAAARSSGAFIGYGEPIQDDVCFTPWDGGVFNNCVGVPKYEVNLMVDTSGSKTVDIVASSGTSCGVAAYDKTGASMFLGATKPSIPLAGGWTQVVRTVSVPSGGTLTAFCNLPTQGRMQSINW